MRSYNYNQKLYEDGGELAHRTIFHAAQEMKSYVKGRVLDLGAGQGHLTEFFTDKAVCLEFSDYNLKKLMKKGFITVKHDLDEPLPFEDGSFDTVFLTDVLEHVERPSFVLKESYRVLSSGGRLLLSVPDLKTKVQPQHLNYYTTNSLIAQLRWAGFNRFKTVYNGVLWSWTGKNPLLNRLLNKGIYMVAFK